MDHVLSFKDPAGHTISAVLSIPAPGSGPGADPETPTTTIAVLCHGFLSSKNSTTNKALSRLLAERGIATLRFDFFGHGESQGPLERITVTLAIEQALAALDLVAARGYQRIGLVGSSFGGLVAVLVAAQREEAAAGAGPGSSTANVQGLACLALKCPVVDFPEELELELGPDGMAEWRRTGTVPNFAGGPGRIRLAFGFYEDARRHVAYGAAPHIRTPTVIVQGDRDELVPLHQSRRLHEALGGPKAFRLIEGADHQFSRGEDFRRMTTIVSDWLITHLRADGARGLPECS